MKRWHKSSSPSLTDDQTKKTKYIRLRSVESQSSSIAVEAKALFHKKAQLTAFIKAHIEVQIEAMIEKVQLIGQKEGISPRQIMNYVRSSIVFKEADGIDSKVVDEIVGEFVKTKITELQQCIKDKDRQINELKEDIKGQTDFSEIKLRSNSVFIPQNSGSVIYQLFNKAKEGSFQEFFHMYNKLHSPNHPSIKMKLSEARLPSQNGRIHRKKSIQEYLKPMLNSLPQQQQNHFLRLLDLQARCSKPCCKWGLQQSASVNPAQMYLTCQVPSNKKLAVYSTAKFKEYCSRYCGKNFKLSNVVSITRTHTQEMERIYSRFKNKQKQKSKQHQRHKSTV